MVTTQQQENHGDTEDTEKHRGQNFVPAKQPAGPPAPAKQSGGSAFGGENSVLSVPLW
ncbi:MAG: hypothetical protein KKH28_10040 [Elusimicrobia bacterium]|nr:hypothetical protein [Elusimicrobiota bacterium]